MKKPTKANFKLICFDLDGTIIDETIFLWQTIHEQLGTDKESRKKAIEDFYAERITYAEWAEHDIKCWKKVGADKKKLMDAIKPLRLMHGTRETLEELKKKGYKLAIVSGSVDFALEYVLPNYREFFDDVFINKVLFNEDGTIKGIDATEFDFKHKATALKKICERENILPKQCVFVGDHENDIHIADLAGFSIAFNCKSDRLAQIANVVIKKKDLREILKHL